MLRVTEPCCSTGANISISNDSDTLFESESIAVTVTLKLPLLSGIPEIFRVEFSIVIKAGGVSPRKSVDEYDNVTTPSMSLANIGTVVVCSLLRIKSSNGSIVGSWPRMLVSAAAALTRPPDVVLPLRL